MEGECQVAGCERGLNHPGPHGLERRVKLRKKKRGPSQPVLAPMEALCQDIGRTIGGVLDNFNARHPDNPRVGFTLMIFTYGEGGDAQQQWMTYISSADRDSMCQSMEEFLDRQAQEPNGNG